MRTKNMQSFFRIFLAAIIGIIIGLTFSFDGFFLLEKHESRKYHSLRDEVLEKVHQKYINEIDYENKSANIDQIINNLDKYSEYIDASEYENVVLGAKGIYRGIGLKIDQYHNIITNVFSGSPAEEAGIMKGDKIVKINNQFVHDNSKINLRDLIANSKIDTTITISRSSISDDLIFKIKKRNFLLPSTESKVVDSYYCYLKIDTFNNKTKFEISNTVKNNCNSISEIQGFVIDVRDNPGGTLEAAIDVSDLFLKKGVIVSAKGRDNEIIFVRTASENDILYGLPIALIINKNSASAAEIFAGALQDNKRAILVGDATTYGKGSIQEVVPLSNGGALILTTARYFRPSGNPISDIGIKPDIKVSYKNTKDLDLKKTEIFNKDAYLSNAITLLKNRKNYF